MPSVYTDINRQPVHAAFCTPNTPEGLDSINPPHLSVFEDRDGDLGLYDPAAERGPVVAPLSQEIPLLLLHSSVVAERLCVYSCGTVPVCMCQS